MMFIIDDKIHAFTYGKYTCARCKAEYTVLDSWEQCSPEFCAPCLKHLRSQFALLPFPEPTH